MDEYTLIKKESLMAVANAIRQKNGTTDRLAFPDGFVTAILALNIGPEAPTSEMLGLENCGGSVVTDGSGKQYSNYVNVGHTSNTTRKNDAVWCFTPGIDASSAVFKFSWDNSIGSVGYSVPYYYAFYLTDVNYGEGRYAESATGKKEKSIGYSDGTKYGSVEITFTGLSLKAGTTYYIRANQNDGTLQTLKAFAKGGNTVQLTT